MIEALLRPAKILAPGNRRVYRKGARGHASRLSCPERSICDGQDMSVKAALSIRLAFYQLGQTVAFSSIAPG